MISYPLANGRHLPGMGLGTWKMTQSEASAAVSHAIAHGYRHIDCAPIYMNEKTVGQGIRLGLQQSGLTREAIWVTSKLWNAFHTPEHVMPALKETLHFMQLDYLDLYLMHWPVAIRHACGHNRPQSSADFIDLADCPLSDTWEAMEACQHAGLTRAIGTANFSQTKLSDLLDHASIAPVVNQVECHPHLPQTTLREYCQRHQIHVTAYASLGSGDRPHQLKGPHEPGLLDHPTVQALATQYQATPAQVLLAWSLAHGCSVIPKSIQPQHQQDNFAAQQLAFSFEDRQRLSALDRHFRYISGEFFTKPGSPYTLANLWDE